MAIPVPVHYEEVYSPRAIAERVAGLGREITPWAEAAVAQTGKELLLVPVLRGAIFFAADLARAMSCSVDLDPVRLIGYDTETNTAKDELIMTGELQVRGRAVLVVDDICDSGRSLTVLANRFQSQGAAAVKTVTLIWRKPVATHKPDYVGFAYEGSEWLVGYGLDDQNRFRNLPGIYQIKK